MLRRASTALAVVPLFAAVSLLSLASPAAAASHWVQGTYQVSIGGNGSETLVLLANHTLGPPGSYTDGTWALQKHMVSIAYTGGEAPFQLCEESGLGIMCNFSITYDGPKTSTGITGTANAYVGPNLVDSEPFSAVRTGGVRSGGG